MNLVKEIRLHISITVAIVIVALVATLLFYEGEKIYFHIVLSRLRYWIASERCSIRTLSLWSRSAIVLLTLSILLYALAEIPSSVMAWWSSSSDWLSSKQCFFICFADIRELVVYLSPLNLSSCIFRASVIFSLISSDDSLVEVEVKSLYCTLGTSTWISILSSKGPEILEM